MMRIITGLSALARPTLRPAMDLMARQNLVAQRTGAVAAVSQVRGMKVRSAVKKYCPNCYVRCVKLFVKLDI